MYCILGNQDMEAAKLHGSHEIESFLGEFQLQFLLQTLSCQIGCFIHSFKQDQVNNANSAFIFMINLFIIQGCHSGSVGRIGKIRLVRLVVQVVQVDWVVQVTDGNFEGTNKVANKWQFFCPCIFEHFLTFFSWLKKRWKF